MLVIVMPSTSCRWICCCKRTELAAAVSSIAQLVANTCTAEFAKFGR